MSDTQQFGLQVAVLVTLVILLVGMAIYDMTREEPTVINQEKVDCYEYDGEMYCKLSKP